LYVNGNVGIYNASPIYALSVGDGTSTRQVVINGLNSGTAGGSSIAVQTNGQTTVMFGNKSNVTGGAYDGQPVFGFGGSTNSLQFYNFNTLNIPAMISSGDRFLIGTTTDNGTDRLQVNGSAIATTLKVNTSGQTVSISSYYNGGTGKNIWIGGGGLSSNSTAQDNVSLGYDALLNNTGGSACVAIGGNALKLNTTGIYNFAIGSNSLQSNISGNYNTAIGASSLAYATASNNTAIGSDCLVEITTGNTNIGIGVQAGRWAASLYNPNQTSNTSIYIGNDTRSSANGNTNEIVIGHNAIGQGSNTVTLGNSSITQTLLRGTVTGGSFVKSGGTSAQILAADGSVITAGTGITISGGTISSTGGGGGTTTFAVTFNNSGTGAASGTTFDGSVARTISYNTLGANKVITSGTAAPTGGVDGDIYLQYDVSLLTGSGTTNYIPKFTSSSAIGNSQIFDNGTNVGIGTASPITGNRLQVDGGYVSVRGVLGGGGGFYLSHPNTTNADARTWGFGASISAFGDFGINQSNAKDGDPITAGTSRFYISNTGNVGIGTTSPGAKLDIYGGAAGTITNLQVGNASTAFVFGVDGANNPQIRTAQSVPILFYTANAERMRITSGGDVGIGTASPAYKLDVTGDIRATGLLQTNNRLYIASDVAISSWISSSLSAGYSATNSYGWLNSANNLVFGTDGLERMRITSGGNVGIGYTSPAAKLALNGTALINTNTDNGVDALQVSGSALVTGNFVAASSSGNVSLRTTANTYAVNINTGANSAIGFYEDGTQSTIIGQNQNLSTTNALSIRGANLDLVGIGATYVRIITNSNERLRIVSAGRILMGTITDNGTDILQVNGNVTATQYSATVQTLTDGATITFNANNGSNAVVTLGGNRTLAFSNTRTGAYYTLRVIQDGTGSRTLAMPGTVKVIGGGAGVITLSTAANSVDIISFYFDGTNYWASYGQNYT
jgi:hypothetical protein